MFKNHDDILEHKTIDFIENMVCDRIVDFKEEVQTERGNSKAKDSANKDLLRKLDSFERSKKDLMLANARQAEILEERDDEISALKQRLQQMEKVNKFNNENLNIVNQNLSKLRQVNKQRLSTSHARHSHIDKIEQLNKTLCEIDMNVEKKGTKN